MDSFQIIISPDNKTYRLTATRKYLMADIERWEVRANNHQFQLDCNRPALVKKNLEHYPWEWRLVAGKCRLWFHKAMLEEMEKVLRGSVSVPKNGQFKIRESL